MKKIGSIQFFEDVDFNLNFTFDDLMEQFKKTSKGIKDEFIDDTDTLKLDVVEEYVEEYVNQKIREKYGNDYSLDVMDETINISWDIKIGSVKKHHLETWWNEESNEFKLPKLKKI